MGTELQCIMNIQYLVISQYFDKKYHDIKQSNIAKP